MDAKPVKLQDFKGILVKSWCQVQKETFRGLAESIPRRLRAVLAAEGDLCNNRQMALILWG